MDGGWIVVVGAAAWVVRVVVRSAVRRNIHYLREQSRADARGQRALAHEAVLVALEGGADEVHGRLGRGDYGHLCGWCVGGWWTG